MIFSPASKPQLLIEVISVPHLAYFRSSHIVKTATIAGFLYRRQSNCKPDECHNNLQPTAAEDDCTVATNFFFVNYVILPSDGHQRLYCMVLPGTYGNLCDILKVVTGNIKKRNQAGKLDGIEFSIPRS